MEYADKYIEQNDLPKHTQIESMAQFGETAMFKQFFSDWRDIDATDGLGETRRQRRRCRYIHVNRR